MSTGGNPDERADFLPVEQRIPILQRNMTVLLSDRIRSGMFIVRSCLWRCFERLTLFFRNGSMGFAS